MSDQTVRLMNLIKEGKSCNEICLALNISSKQLFSNLTNLRNLGLLYRRKYYSNGMILYRPIQGIYELNQHLSTHNDSSIITSHKTTNLKCLVISDLHFGNEFERLDLLDRAYDYCSKKGIHIILCCGDMIDGTYSKGEQLIGNIYEQIKHFIKDYPFDKNILTFCVAGDHDFSALNQGSQDIMEIVKSYRHDIIIGGYGTSYINIKNDALKLLHHIQYHTNYAKDCPLILEGHRHKYSIASAKDQALTVTVPSLSDINQSLPTAVELNLQFNKGYINFATLSQIHFGDKDYVLSEVSYDLMKNREVEFGTFQNEEIVKDEDLTIVEKEIPMVLQKQNTRDLSQIEKFNLRYGIES